MSKGFGEMCEMEFIVRAMRLGLKVSRPLTETKYDVVIDNGKNLLRIQVKGTRSINNKGAMSYGVMTSYGAYGKKLYDKTHMDFFAIFVEPENIWFIVPVDEINYSKITLSPHAKKSKYTPFKDAWHLIQ